MSRKILAHLAVALLIIATCQANRAAKSNGDIEATGDARQRVLHPRAEKPRDRTTLILLVPEEESLAKFSEEDATPRSSKTKRCKTCARKVRLSPPPSTRTSSAKLRQIDDSRGAQRLRNDRREHALSRGPSVRIIPLRDPKAMPPSGLGGESSSPERIANSRENIALLKVLEDNLKPRQGEISATNKRRQRAKPAPDDSRYVCYCREEHEHDANSPKGLSRDPLLKENPPASERKNKCGRKQAHDEIIGMENAPGSSFPEVPDNRFIPRGFPVLYPSVPQIPRLPINAPERVGAASPVPDGLANLPYLPVVYKMQPELAIAPNTLTGDAPVRMNIPTPMDSGFNPGQRPRVRTKPKRPCVPITERPEFEPTDVPTENDSDDSIIGMPHSAEATREEENDSSVGMPEKHWFASEQEAEYDECIKLYGRKVCVITATPQLRPRPRTNFQNHGYDYPVKGGSDKDCNTETDSGILESKPDNNGYSTNDGTSQNDNDTDEMIAAKHDEPEDNYTHHEPETNLGKGTNQQGPLDYSDISEVTSFTSRTYETETQETNFESSTPDDIPTTTNELLINTDEPINAPVPVHATSPASQFDESVGSPFNPDETFTIKPETDLTPTEMDQASKSAETEPLGQGEGNDIPQQGTANNNEETYEETTHDDNVGATNTETEKFPAPADSREKNPNRNCEDSPKLGQPKAPDDNVPVQWATHPSSGEAIESRDEEIVNTTATVDENKEAVPEMQTALPARDSDSENSGNAENDSAVEKIDDITETTISAINTETYDQTIDSLTGVTPSTANVGEDESWKAALPFCDNTVLQNSIKKVINNFASKNGENGKENDGETVGASLLPHDGLLTEVLEVPHLKEVLAVPQIEGMIVEKVKDLISEVSGVSRKSFANDWTTKVITSNLNHMMSGTKSKPGKQLPPMTVEEREFRDGAWQTHLATIAPVPEDDQKSLSNFESVKDNMRNILEDPSVGIQAAKHPIVQNMIVESFRNHHRFEETKIRGALDHLVGQMRETDENEEGSDVDKLITTDSTTKPANDDAYYDDDVDDIITNPDKTDNSVTDNPEEPKVGSSLMHTDETIPTEDENNNDFETSKNVNDSNINQDDTTNPTQNAEPQLKSENEPPEIKASTSKVDIGDINDNDNLEETGSEAPTKFFTPNDRILNYIKNHQTGTANAGSNPEDAVGISRDEGTSTSHTDLTETHEEATISAASDTSDPNVGMTQSFLDTPITESSIPLLTEAPESSTITEDMEDQIQDTDTLVGKSDPNSTDSEVGSSASDNHFPTNSQDNCQTTNSQYLKTHEVTTTDIQKVTKTTRYFQPFPTRKMITNTNDPYDNEPVEEDESNVSTLVGAGHGIPNDSLDSEPAEDYAYFGKIVPNKHDSANDIRSLQQSDLFFVGDGVRLPLEIRRQNDGSYALSISRKVCEKLLRKDCPCCVPRQGNVVRSVRKNVSEQTQKRSTLYNTNRDSSRIIRSGRNTRVRQMMPNDRVKRESSNDSIMITMPVEVFAKKYNLSLDLANIKAFGTMDERKAPNRYTDDTSVYNSARNVPFYGLSRDKKSGRFSSVEQSDERSSDRDLYVVIDGRPKRIRHLDWDTIDSDELLPGKHTKLYSRDDKDPIVDRIAYFPDDQREPVRYRYHRNVDGTSDRRTEVAKNMLNWLRDLFINANPSDDSTH